MPIAEILLPIPVNLSNFRVALLHAAEIKANHARICRRERPAAEFIIARSYLIMGVPEAVTITRREHYETRFYLFQERIT